MYVIYLSCIINIPKISHYKYLGTDICKNGSLQRHFKAVCYNMIATASKFTGIRLPMSYSTLTEPNNQRKNRQAII